MRACLTHEQSNNADWVIKENIICWLVAKHARNWESFNRIHCHNDTHRTTMTGVIWGRSIKFSIKRILKMENETPRPGSVRIEWKEIMKSKLTSKGWRVATTWAFAQGMRVAKNEIMSQIVFSMIKRKKIEAFYFVVLTFRRTEWWRGGKCEKFKSFQLHTVWTGMVERDDAWNGVKSVLYLLNIIHWQLCIKAFWYWDE